MHNYAVAGVLGGTGYAGLELVRLLGGHGGVRVAWATSRSEAGASLPTGRGSDAVPLLDAESADLGSVDVVLSCLPHGDSLPWVERALCAGARVVDLSADLRVPAPGLPDWAGAAVYGFPEGGRDELRGARLVSNPGCYPTAVLTGLLPAVRRGLVTGPVVITAASGVTGAGRSPKRELLFAEVAEDFRAYGVGNTHRHLEEMSHHAVRLSGLAEGTHGSGLEIVFTPHLLPVKRGILATMYVPVTAVLKEPWRLWSDDYAGERFIRVLEGGIPTLSSVVGSNRVVIGVVPVRSRTPAVQVVVALDNLIKGAAGQAVQNLNLALGWDEAVGLPC